MMPLAELAEQNLSVLRNTSYPGRGFVLGVTPDGKNLVQIYWLMGRSAPSRNRVLISPGSGKLSTEPADASKESGNPYLTIYDAMLEKEENFVVSNGRQTCTVSTQLWRGDSFSDILKEPWKYEPDAPNFTPRITGAWLGLEKPLAIIGVLRKARGSDACERLFFEYPHIEPGFGVLVHTYMGDGKPLPAFRGEPREVRIPCDWGGSNATFYWQHLNAENRVALAVKYIERATGKSTVHIINEYKKVPAS
ncbi:MAG: hypothetical protein A2849_02655 [Candidatus Taylorbacteria bacterium RIFCSPHIGHO2_01_FULL_51_15]|uniref:Inosine monophosphate cyclohydrolase-like domain-containing protein n=1 Tax=Candidatus Taylorbacteria bacterium RIFCSPHIGHO2_01_FULL_51_15 TaxID=1802304 RepID=A0A1G2MD56_9BACT|nr:MAG: hypothetical protein A2849_02655 [Candidatus Taylorbacteria bacterium RIFCSPHIGHO2_01_FULL_51_15]